LSTSLATTLAATRSSPRLGSGTNSSKFSIFFVSSRLGDGKDGVDGQRSEESGVLTNNLAVEGGADRLDERVTIGELDGDSHGRVDLNSLGGCLVEVPSPTAESWDLESSTSIFAAG